MTQAEMAAACGVAKGTYTNYEPGARVPDAEFLIRAARAGVNIAYVMGVEVAGFMSEPQMPVSKIEAAIRAVQQAQIDRLAFVDPSRIWPALQHTATFGESTVGGYPAKARSEVDAALGIKQTSTRGTRKTSRSKK